MKFLLLAREIGGQFLESGAIFNYPGIVKTTGVEFSAIMEEQLAFNGDFVETCYLLLYGELPTATEKREFNQQRQV